MLIDTSSEPEQLNVGVADVDVLVDVEVQASSVGARTVHRRIWPC